MYNVIYSDANGSLRAVLRALVPVLLALCVFAAGVGATELEVKAFTLPAGTHPHDVASAPDGSVWYTAQHQAALGRLDPATGRTEHIPLGDGAAPHGVIVGPDGAPWVTDSGLNVIVRVDPSTHEVRVLRCFLLPSC